jgi:DNA-binding MarR family transcriptional regulator
MKTTATTAALFTEVGLLIKSRMQAAVAMPFSQCQTLWFVAKHVNTGEPISMQDVARYFKIRAPSATFLVEELVRGGYITRKINSKDRRKVELALTPKGNRAFKTFEAKRNLILAKLFGRLEERDRTELNRILRKMIESS